MIERGAGIVPAAHEIANPEHAIIRRTGGPITAAQLAVNFAAQSTN